MLDLPITVETIYRSEYMVWHFNEGEIREEEGPPRPRKKKEDASAKTGTPKTEEGAKKEDQPTAQRETAAGEGNKG